MSHCLSRSTVELSSESIRVIGGGFIEQLGLFFPQHAGVSLQNCIDPKDASPLNGGGCEDPH